MENKDLKNREEGHLRLETDKFSRQMNERRIRMLVEKFQPALDEDELRR